MDTRKTCLITGTSSGIGHSLAREFNSRGFRVFATARTTDKIADLETLGIETLSLEVDKKESVDAVKADISKRTGGKLDYLVNNAGRNYTVPALEVDFDEVQKTFDVNVFSVMRMCQAFAPLLIEAKGTIIQTGSLTAYMPYVFGATYNASKAALTIYSDTLRLELAPFGVRVITLVTGGVQSMIARTDRTLRDGSLYIPIEDEFLRRVKHSQDGGVPADVFARRVADRVLRKNPPKYVWEGNKSWLVWFLLTFFPNGTMDRVFRRMFKLWKLEQPAKTKAS